MDEIEERIRGSSILREDNISGVLAIDRPDGVPHRGEELDHCANVSRTIWVYERQELPVAKGYWINQSDVTDEAGHAVYAKAVAEYLARQGATTLVFSQAGRREVVEGSPRSRQLIQEFPDYESALAAYHSEEYQAIKQLRRNTATIDLVIAEGFDPAAH